jgi:Flp pilus assembly protein CpaB
MTYQLRNVVVAVALGLLAAVLVTAYVTNYRKHVQHGQQNVAVLVAAVDIPSGTSGSAIVAGHML